MLVHRAPQVTDLAIDFEEDLIQMPLIAGLWATAFELVSVDLAELAAPLPNRCVGHEDAARGKEFFDITVAEGETEVEPDGVAMISAGKRWPL